MPAFTFNFTCFIKKIIKSLIPLQKFHRIGSGILQLINLIIITF